MVLAERAEARALGAEHAGHRLRVGLGGVHGLYAAHATRRRRLRLRRARHSRWRAEGDRARARRRVVALARDGRHDQDGAHAVRASLGEANAAAVAVDGQDARHDGRLRRPVQLDRGHVPDAPARAVARRRRAGWRRLLLDRDAGRQERVAQAEPEISTDADRARRNELARVDEEVRARPVRVARCGRRPPDAEPLHTRQHRRRRALRPVRRGEPGDAHLAGGHGLFEFVHRGRLDRNRCSISGAPRTRRRRACAQATRSRR